ncbi:MAG: ABC transporter ATP-binding protein [Bifidobacteriaceae bacterium]|jgi:ABC-2 type transport system ATP-binding protein|nr:ABC transporter ATP-binding protein [Bifidobacteriaceae bacterium]
MNNRSSAPAGLELSGVSFAYSPAHPVLDALSFKVRRGEIYALLGRNGAGKTTCLELIEGLRGAHAGSCRLFGDLSPRHREARRRVGVMFQDPAVPGDLTPPEALALFGEASGRMDDAARAVRSADLGSRTRVRAADLSGGERRRLDFAIAAWGAPDLLILDEPTNGMDLDSRDWLWGEVRRARDAGCAVLATTHYLEEARANADRIGILRKGMIAAEGSYDQLAQDRGVQVRFRLSGPVDSSWGEADLDGAHGLRTTDVHRTVTGLVDEIRRAGVRLVDLEATRTSLHDLILGPSGRDLDEEVAAR